MTFEVQQNRWDQTIRRASGSIGPGSRVSETLGELFPVFDVENLPLELMLLSGWTLGQGVGDKIAVAARFSKVQLFNPATSGKLIVLTRVDLTTSAAQLLRYSLAETALALDTGNVVARDTREGITGAGVGQMRTEDTPGGVAAFGQFFLTTNVSFPFTEPHGLFVLAPGTGITFSCTTANTTLRGNFLWRERVALESELNI